jgi:hypothetical protein
MIGMIRNRKSSRISLYLWLIFMGTPAVMVFA